MRRKGVFVFAVVCLFPLRLFAEPFLGTDEAISILRARLLQEKVFLEMKCVLYVKEDESAEYIGIALREKHEGACPGDPDVSPIIERYRLNRKTRAVEWYNALDDEYLTFEAGLRLRKGK